MSIFLKKGPDGTVGNELRNGTCARNSDEASSSRSLVLGPAGLAPPFAAAAAAIPLWRLYPRLAGFACALRVGFAAHVTPSSPGNLVCE